MLWGWCVGRHLWTGLGTASVAFISVRSGVAQALHAFHLKLYISASSGISLTHFHSLGSRVLFQLPQLRQPEALCKEARPQKKIQRRPGKFLVVNGIILKIIWIATEVVMLIFFFFNQLEHIICKTDVCCPQRWHRHTDQVRKNKCHVSI